MGHCQSSIQNKIEDKKSMLSIFEDKIIFWYINMSGEGADLIEQWPNSLFSIANLWYLYDCCFCSLFEQYR